MAALIVKVGGMDSVEEVPVSSPCSVCGNWVESTSEDPETGLVVRRPCGCVD